jgi:hypothetical protein
VVPPEIGPIRSRAILGGLHHRYYRDAAWRLSGWCARSASGGGVCLEATPDSEEVGFDCFSRRLGLPPGFPAIGPAPSDAQEIGRLGYSEGTATAEATVG